MLKIFMKNFVGQCKICSTIFLKFFGGIFMKNLNHFDKNGKAIMVDVSEKNYRTRGCCERKNFCRRRDF